MRKLIMWNSVSLDGYFEGPNGDLSWVVHDENVGEYVKDSNLAAGALLFGCRTYQMMAAHWPSADGALADFMNGVPKFVCSTTLERAEWRNTTILRGNPAEDVARLKKQPGNDIMLFGSADLAATLTRHGLIDEYHLRVHPVVVGSGTRLFKESPDRVPLTLREAQPLTSGLVLLRYAPA